MGVRDVKMGRGKERRAEEVGVKTGHVSGRMCLRGAHSPPEQGGVNRLYI